VRVKTETNTEPNCSLREVIIIIFARMDRLVIVVGDPLCIVRELGETSFEALIFAHLVGAVRGFHQFGIFARFGAILLSGEHGRAFL
jgi:hypothetical protein